MKTLQHKFVEFIPDVLEEGVIYISMVYKTAAHNCVCGCHGRVVTPISPTDWQLVYNGVSISLNPSIGNWNFACKSHYWLIKGQVKFCRDWSRAEIDDGQMADIKRKEKYFKKKQKNKIKKKKLWQHFGFQEFGKTQTK